MKEFFKKHALSIICYLLSLALVFALLFYPKQRAEGDEKKKVVRVWNIDTFEGGKGSRTSFLKSAARRVEKKEDGVYFLVTSYTLEGALAAFEEGLFPDALSFGVGMGVFLEKSLPLNLSFTGGTVGKDCYAYPWCRGGYALFSLDENFGEEGRVAISSGGENLACLAAAMSGIEGKTVDSMAAYTGFLSGKYRYLLGTQRDLNRFQTRGVAVKFRPLDAFSDLYQYFSILNPALKGECEALLDALLSAPEKLEEIGMFPPFERSEFAPLPKQTLSVFSSLEALEKIREDVLKDPEKIPENFLKTI